MNPSPKRPLIDFDFQCELKTDLEVGGVQNLMYRNGLAGCYVAPSLRAPGTWIINLSSRQIDGGDRLLSEVTRIVRKIFPEAVCGVSEIDGKQENGLSWVFLNGPIDGLGSSEHAAD